MKGCRQMRYDGYCSDTKFYGGFWHQPLQWMGACYASGLSGWSVRYEVTTFSLQLKRISGIGTLRSRYEAQAPMTGSHLCVEDESHQGFAQRDALLGVRDLSSSSITSLEPMCV